MNDKISNGKDQFYYSVSEYERRKNPSISNEELDLKVSKYREAPESFHAMAYKELTGGKTIDKKTLDRVSQIEGVKYDPSKLKPSEINYVDNEKTKAIELKKNKEDLLSKMVLGADATDKDFEEYWRKQNTRSMSYENKEIKENFISKEKQKQAEYKEAEKQYKDYINSTALTNIDPLDFYKDAQKKTEKSGVLAEIAMDVIKKPGLAGKVDALGTFVGAVYNKRDIFSGNDDREERVNAALKSREYIDVLTTKLQDSMSFIKEEKEQKIVKDFLEGKEPKTEKDFVPSKELSNFLETYRVYTDQLELDATSFGGDVSGKKKSYYEHKSDYENARQQKVDKNQKWVTGSQIKQYLAPSPMAKAMVSAERIAKGEVPSVTETWFNSTIKRMGQGLGDVGDAFWSNSDEEKIKEAKKSGNMEEYKRLQNKAMLKDYVEHTEFIDKTLQRTDLTAPLWEETVDVDGFKLRVNYKKEFQGLIGGDGKTVHNLSGSQKKAVEKYMADPDSYKTNSGFSNNWSGALFNAAGGSSVDMIPMIAGGALTAPLRAAGALGAAASTAASSAPMFLISYPEYFRTEFEETGDWTRSSSYATTMAGVESAMEGVFGIGAKSGAKLVGKGLTPDKLRLAAQVAAREYAEQGAKGVYNSSFAKNLLKELAKDNLEEWGEEFLTLIAHSAIDKTYGKDGHIDMNEILTTLLVTPMATTPLSGVSNTVNLSRNNKNNFKVSVIAAASDPRRSKAILEEMLAQSYMQLPIVPKKFQEQYAESIKKKVELVEGLSQRMKGLQQRVSGENLSITKDENQKVIDYLFDEAMGVYEGKPIDNKAKIDEIIFTARTRTIEERIGEKSDLIVPIEPTEKNPVPKSQKNDTKDENGFTTKASVSVDGDAQTFYNTNDFDDIHSDIGLNFNIEDSDAEILVEEIKAIADRKDIKLKGHVLGKEINSDIPLIVSFLSVEDAREIYAELLGNEYYIQSTAKHTDRILGKKLDDKVQFGARNVKDLKDTQDLVDRAFKNEDGVYGVEEDGMFIPIPYERAQDILFASDNMWGSEVTPNAQQEQNAAVQENPTPVEEGQQVNTRFTDEEGFERMNAKTDATLQDAFDYQEGDRKEIPVYKNGVKGNLRINEGGAIEFDDGKQITEYGNINDLRTTTLSEIGLTPAVDVSLNKGQLVIDGQFYVNPYSSPDAAITRDEAGNVVSVDLEKRTIRGGYNGIMVNDTSTPVTFTGQQAVDVSIMLMEHNLQTDPKLREEFERYPAPNIQPNLVPNNVTVEQLGGILLEYFPEKPALALETAKIYFAHANRMSRLFPQQYPTPQDYLIEKINKDTVNNATDIEKIKDKLQGVIDSNAPIQRKEAAQRHLDKINKIETKEPVSSQVVVDEINSKPLTHISMGKNAGMGSNEAVGTYLSTEKVNRYEKAAGSKAKKFTAKVNIKNPYDLDSEGENIDTLRNKALKKAVTRYILDSGIDGDLKTQIETIESFDSDLTENFPGLDVYIAQEVTNYLQDRGFDSLYSRETDTREGYLIVFDRDSVSLTEVVRPKPAPKEPSKAKPSYGLLSKMIESLNLPDLRLNAISIVISGNINASNAGKETGLFERERVYDSAKKDYVYKITRGLEEFRRMFARKLVSTKENAPILEKIIETNEFVLDGTIDMQELRGEVITMLSSFDLKTEFEYVQSIVDAKEDPDFIVNKISALFELDLREVDISQIYLDFIPFASQQGAVYQALVNLKKEQIESDVAKAEMEQLGLQAEQEEALFAEALKDNKFLDALVEQENAMLEAEARALRNADPVFYEELEITDNVEMSFEDIQILNDFLDSLDLEQNDIVESINPFDPQFEAINQLIENKKEDAKRKDNERVANEDSARAESEIGNEDSDVGQRQEGQDVAVDEKIKNLIKERDAILSNINNFVLYFDENGDPCAKAGLTNTVKGSNWTMVKDFKGYPKHSQGGVDISLSQGGFSMLRSGKEIKAEFGLVLPAMMGNNDPENNDPNKNQVENTDPPVKTVNEILLEKANALEGGGYSWGKESGSPYEVKVGDNVVLKKQTKGSYCSGYTCGVVMDTLNEKGKLSGLDKKQLSDFKQLWYGGKGYDKSKKETWGLSNTALEKYELGKSVASDEGQPGDIAQIWRKDGSGHSVIFKEWVEDDKGDVVGVKYRSTQEKTKGIGDRIEYFKNSKGKEVINKDDIFLARLND